MNSYKITFKNGLQNPVVIEAPDIEDAKKRGLAHYRKNSGFVETVDLKETIDSTIESVVEVQ